MSRRRYVVSYDLPYRHQVSVGIWASSRKAAIAKASRAFDDGTIWDDTLDMPLIYDDFEEDECAGEALSFEAESAKPDDWKADAGVRQWQQDLKARAACKALIEAYQRGAESGDSTDWSDVDAAYELALEAMPHLRPKDDAAEEARA